MFVSNHAVLLDDVVNRSGGMIPEVLVYRGVEEYTFIPFVEKVSVHGETMRLFCVRQQNLRLCRTLRTDYR